MMILGEFRLKKSKVLRNAIICVMILCIVLCVARVIIINKRFPNAESVCYTQDNPANINGIDFIPLEVHVYSVQDYSSIYGDSRFDKFSESAKKNGRIVVMTVKANNTTDVKMKFFDSMFEMVVEDINGFNGVASVDGNIFEELNPHEEKEFTVSGYLGLSQISKEELDKIDSSNITLVFSFYPVRRKLVF